MIRKCLVCSKEYTTYPCKLKKGWQLFCSKLCSSLARGTKVKRICLICGKEFIVKRMAIKNSGAKYCSRVCQWKGQEGKEKPSIQGANHLNWKGGVSVDPYPFKFNGELKDKIRQRDNHTCQLCELVNEEHILIYGYELMVHHIDYIKENCEESNLISLCNQCHGRTNYNRTYWTEFFINKKKEKSNEKVI